MKLSMVGCTHELAPLAVRERLAMSPAQTEAALVEWRQQFPDTEAVLISTCNRVELYTAAQDPQFSPNYDGVVQFLAEWHQLPAEDFVHVLIQQSGEDAVRHLFAVAASLESMVVGEPQILAQVKDAYRLANASQSTGPVTHDVFQSAVRVARRVATETTIHQRRVSIPSLAIADFASQIFERFDDKQIVVVGAGEMAEETLRHLRDQGSRQVTVINQSAQRAERLAQRWQGVAQPWEQRYAAIARADVVISTTASSEPIVSQADFDRQIAPHRHQRPLFILDLAVPRDFEPTIADALGVYLYSIDDLTEACRQNRQAREEQLPAALKIIDEETARFMADLYHRSTGPIIERLRKGWHEPKERELKRLLNKLPDLDDKARGEIAQSFDRLINKLLHPPLESLRDESRHGTPHGLLDALKRLFQLKE